MPGTGIRMDGVKAMNAARRRDYKLCRETDKILSDFARHKDKHDRKKIESEFFQAQKEYKKA